MPNAATRRLESAMGFLVRRMGDVAAVGGAAYVTGEVAVELARAAAKSPTVRAIALGAAEVIVNGLPESPTQAEQRKLSPLAELVGASASLAAALLVRPE